MAGVDYVGYTEQRLKISAPASEEKYRQKLRIIVQS
jgi:hypothetical protein